MFERRERIERWFHDVVEKFRQKGAVSPDKAMTAGERFSAEVRRGNEEASGSLRRLRGSERQVLSFRRKVETNRRTAICTGRGMESRKQDYDVETVSVGHYCSLHHSFPCKPLRSELGAENSIRRPFGCLASDSHAADILSLPRVRKRYTSQQAS